jgi:cytoplasmic iron level regulating protein YaaA (DUF328/UPF0246 family)
MSRDYNKKIIICQEFLELFCKIFNFFSFCDIISLKIGVFMKILFSPSEGKIKKGEGKLDINSFSFNSHDRNQLLQRYQNFLNNASFEELSKLFGLKKESDILENKKIDIFKEPTLKAIAKYDGVAYDYLTYTKLSKMQQDFIDENVIIFSNLFGFLLAKDKIPYYRLKQGEKIDGFDIAKYYHDNFSKELDEYLKDELIIDLRAKHYEKFYTIKKPYITCKFLKNGKVVSHWAKAYRGTLLKELSKHQPQNEDEFASIEFENLMIKEIVTKGKMREFVYEIVG